MKLRIRIYSCFAVLMAALLVVGTVVVVSQRSRLVAQLDDQLLTVAPLNRVTPRPPSGGAQRSGENVIQQDPPISDLYIATVSADGTVQPVVQGQLLDSTPAIDAEQVTSTGTQRFATVSATDGSTDFRVLMEPSDTRSQFVVIAFPMDDVNESIRQLSFTLGLLALFTAALLGLLAGWITRLGLRPISEMTVAATAIAAGDREQRVPELDPRTEVGQLSTAFNEMLDQRDGADDRLRRFVSDASHELRTPLTSVTGYIDLYSQGGFRQPGQLDDAIRRIRSEADRMTALIENLLQLARFDEEQPLERSRFELATLVDEVIADSGAAHPGRRVDADIDPAMPPVLLDRFKIQQLVLGLVNNALTHAPEATVTIRCRRRDQAVELAVVDDGPGLSAEQAERAFERFYRGDPARARSSGGSGLGLSIAHSIATAHGGTIELSTAPGQGCEFTILLPIAFESAGPQLA